VTRLISEGWEKKVGGKLEFYTDWATILEKSLSTSTETCRAQTWPFMIRPLGRSGDVSLAPFLPHR